MKKNVKGKSGEAAEVSRSANPPAGLIAAPTPRSASSRKKAVATAAANSSPSPSATTRPRPARTRAAADGGGAGPELEPILTQLRDLREMLEKLIAPPAAADAVLDSSVDSMRRLLSELLEQRLESVVKDLVGIRSDAANLPGDGAARVVARLDQLLEELGAVRYTAEPMDLVDPLIHSVVDERRLTDTPDGVIIETVRPGYRTARGLVVCKAAVAINQRL